MSDTLTYTVPGVHCDHCRAAIEGEVTVSDGNNKVVYPWLAKRAR